jgi:hypothetical protein
MDFSVYEHLLEEQKERYLDFREVYPNISERVCQQLFFSQIQEMNLTNIINEGFFAQEILTSGPIRSRRKQPLYETYRKGSHNV